MTRQHFEAIANMVRAEINLNRKANLPAGCFAARSLALQLADYFESQNPRFDRQRFLTACGV